MGISRGKAIDPESGEVVGYLLYQNTSDVAFSRLWRDESALDDSRDASGIIGYEAFRSECLCKIKSNNKNVFLYVDYGGGLYWPGVVCTSCMAIVSELSPYPDYCNSPRDFGWGDPDELWPLDGYPAIESK